MQARPLAIRLPEAPWHSGLSPEQIAAFHAAGKLPFIELGETQLVLMRDLEKLLDELLQRGGSLSPPRARKAKRDAPATPDAAKRSPLPDSAEAP